MANVVLQAEKGPDCPGDVATRLKLISELLITTDYESAMRAWREVIALARAENLTAYDAAYLELAVRCGLPLSTRDDTLIGAARRVGVTVLA